MKLIALFILINSFIFSVESGSLIVFAGISGSGKSSLAKNMAVLCEAECFLEPEEHMWPSFIREKTPYGECAAYTVFRAMRVDALWKAVEKKKGGQVIFSDSYYDKITSYYLGKPGMEWLIAPEDPYYPCVEALSILDTQLLPNADLIVLLDIPYSIWVERLQKRGRARDFLEGFQESYSLYRSYIEMAVRRVSQEHNIPVLVFSVTEDSISVQSEKLLSLLIEQKIVSSKKGLL